MTFTWPEYVQVAEDLLNMKRHTAGGEAIVRAAVSRAYYAAHQTAHDELARRGVALPNRPSVHEQVIQAFFAVGNAAWKQVGIELDDLRRLSVHADYHRVLPAEWGADERALRNKAVLAVLRSRALLRSIAALP